MNKKLPENLQRRVDALKLKTVSNGATESEQKTAQEMVRRIYQRHLNQVSTKPEVIVAPDDLSLEEYEQSVLNGSIESKITRFDWDEIAKQELDMVGFNEYVFKTRLEWERYSYTYYRLTPPEGVSALSRNDYRRFTYKIFNNILRRS